MTNKPHFTTLEAAQRLQRAPITLQKWRVLGLGPLFFYQGRHVLYALADLKAFERHYAEQLIEEILETSRPITKTQALAGLLGISICTIVPPKRHDFIGPRVSQLPASQPVCQHVH